MLYFESRISYTIQFYNVTFCHSWEPLIRMIVKLILIINLIIALTSILQILPYYKEIYCEKCHLAFEYCGERGELTTHKLILILNMGEICLIIEIIISTYFELYTYICISIIGFRFSSQSEKLSLTFIYSYIYCIEIKNSFVILFHQVLLLTTHTYTDSKCTEWRMSVLFRMLKKVLF